MRSEDRLANYGRLAPVNVRERKQNRRTVLAVILAAAYFAVALILAPEGLRGLSAGQLAGIFAAFAVYLASLSSLVNGEVTIGMAPPVCLAALIFTLSRFGGELAEAFSGRWSFPRVLLLAAVTALTAASAVFVVTFAAMLISSLRTVGGDESVTAVVLGCRLDGDRPGRILRRRLERTQRFLTERPDVKCILSGGQVADELCPEADAMLGYLTDAGLPRERFIVENRSQTTYENIRFSKALAEENGLPIRFAVVTDRFHQLRVQLIGRDNGVECRAVNVRTPVCLALQYWSREVLCLLEKRIKGL